MVQTGSKFTAGTDANVYISLFGKQNKIVRYQLQNSVTNKNSFEKGQKDEFVFKDIDIGQVRFFLSRSFVFNSLKISGRIPSINMRISDRRLIKIIKHIQSFLKINEQILTTINSTSLISTNKNQTIDNMILNKILSKMDLVFESSNSLSLLEHIYPILILAFQHNKISIRNKTRKYWNETFGRLKFIIYPNELR